MKNFAALTLFFISLAVFGRSPAVEPVRGISIEEYREVTPNQDPGFNWQQSDFVEETSLITTRTPAENQLIENTQSQRKSWPTYLFLVGLISLPFVLWYSVMKSLESGENHHVVAENTGYGNVDNTVNLSQERARRQSEEEDKDLPKAS